MTTPNHQAELLPCPNPWCEAQDRGPDFTPVVNRGHFNTRYVTCTSCCMKGPLAQSEAEAIAAWNTRPASHEAELVEALEWYAEQTRLCRLIHSGGDAGRHALQDDGGKRAQSALAKAKAGAA